MAYNIPRWLTEVRATCQRDQNHCTDVNVEKNYLQSLWGSKIPSPRGLQNNGTNTCYLNASLQVLTFIPEVFKNLSTTDHNKTCDKKDFCIDCELVTHVEKYTLGSDRPFNPRRFIDNTKSINTSFVATKHHDAFDCLNGLIQRFNDDKFNDLGRHFVSTGVTHLLCHKAGCEHVGVVNDAVKYFELDNADHSQTTLEKLFEHSITNSNSFNHVCPECQGLGNEELRYINNLADILVLKFNKPAKDIKYSEVLDTSSMKCVHGEDKYQLHGVIVHSGNAQTGHYTCYIKTPHGKWFSINDSIAKEVSADVVLHHRGAYICVYRNAKLDATRQHTADAIADQEPVISADVQKSLKRKRMEDPRQCNPRVKKFKRSFEQRIRDYERQKRRMSSVDEEEVGSSKRAKTEDPELKVICDFRSREPAEFKLRRYQVKRVPYEKGNYYLCNEGLKMKIINHCFL